MSDETLSVGPYRISLDDLAVTQRLMKRSDSNPDMAWFFHICTMIGFIVLFLAVCSGIFALLGHSATGLNSGGALLVLGFLGGVVYELFLALVWRPSELSRGFKSRWEGREFTVTLSASQVEYRVGARVTVLPWTEVESVATTPSILVLSVGSPYAIPVPGRAFASPDDMKRFYDHAREWFAATTQVSGNAGVPARKS